MSDWIASGELFTHNTSTTSDDRVNDAWEHLQLIAPWKAVTPNESATSLLSERFSLPYEAAARPVQDEALRLVETTPDAGLLIVEAPMGEGKTELALLCAEVMAARTGAGGVMFCLPTQATADGIFERIQGWVNSVPDQRSGDTRQSSFLAHGKARLNDHYTGLERVGRLSTGDDSLRRHRTSHDAMVAHTWLSGRHKGLLANFVVATIDQALRAVLKSRYFMLRHLALANKVVVIDEVHASDTYMKVYLERLLMWLGAYEVPTILMSATLSPADRSSFIDAYATTSRSRLNSAPANDYQAADSQGYPQLTVISHSGDMRVSCPPASSRAYRVAVEYLDDDLTSLVHVLQTLLAEGGAAGIIRNTVSRAQETAAHISDYFPDAEILVIHARFLSRDRAHIEKYIRQLLGPDDNSTGIGTRFCGRPVIVIGTQVLEQSLDIDFDVMVSDLAPMDLLMQRVGRLHRHNRHDRPSALKAPQLFITGADWKSWPPVLAPGSKAVYGSLQLLASVITLEKANRSFVLPQDIARYVTYSSQLAETRSPDELPVGWDDAWSEAFHTWRLNEAGKENRAEDFLLGKPSSRYTIEKSLAAATNDSEAIGNAQVRDADASLEVLVVQRIEGEIRTLPSADRPGQPVPTDLWWDDRRLEFAIASSSLRLPATFTQAWTIETVIAELEHNKFDAWQNSPILRGELALVLDADLRTTLAGIPLKYDANYGLLMSEDI